MQQKDYKKMTPQEQMAWLTDFGQWSNDKLPVLCALGDAWESSHIKSMEEGLKLISAFSYCRDFVEKSLMFRDFSRRVDRIRFYVEKIKREVAAGTAIKTANGQTLAVVPQIQPRRRGRPTREEAAAKARMKNNEAEAALLAAEAPQPQPTEQGDLFSSVQEVSAMPLMTEGKLHLDQLSWLMSDGLKSDIKTIAGLRAVAAKESEQAKALADNGVPQAVIEPHTQAAIEAKEAYLLIYSKVDYELSQLYSLLSIGGEHLPKYEQMCAARNITIDQLKGILKPYWEKMGCPVVQLESVTESVPELSPEERAKRSARLHNIRTYFIRKDLKVSQKRVEKMRALIEEVKGYGLPVDEYEAILAKTEEELKTMKE